MCVQPRTHIRDGDTDLGWLCERAISDLHARVCVCVCVRVCRCVCVRMKNVWLCDELHHLASL